MTRDGGCTWQEQKLNLPTSLSDGELDYTAFPKFFSDNSKEGIINVRFDSNNHQKDNFATIIYITHDFGATWQDIRIVKGLDVPVDFINSNEWWYWESQPRASSSGTGKSTYKNRI